MTENFKLYKPRKSGDGAASQWNVNPSKKAVFLELAQQIGPMGSEKMFDWENKICVKLGTNDIGELIATLENRQTTINGGKGLFHQTETSNASVNLTRGDNGWFLNVGVKKEELVKISHTITFGEGALLLTLLRIAVQRIYEW